MVADDIEEDELSQEPVEAIATPRKTGRSAKAPETPEDAAAARLMNGAMKQIISAERESRSKKTAQESMKTLKAAMGQLSDEAFRTLLADDDFQGIFEKVSERSGTKPGDPVFDGNGRHIGYVPYSFDDYWKIYPKQTWTPMRTDRIEVNGVALQVYEGLTVTAPKVFYDIQQESIKAEREAVTGQRDAVAKAPGFFADDISHGVGWYKRNDEELIRAEGVER
jgi:hypothetical protein